MLKINLAMLIYLFIGVYGYIRFAQMLWSGKKTLYEFKKEQKRKITYNDLIVGLFSLNSFIILKTKEVQNNILVFIPFLFGTSLILKSFRNYWNISSWNVIKRKLFNYIANSYILLSIISLTVVAELLKIPAAIYLVLGLYFGTFFLIWRKI